jgi:hypothetical protein
VEQIGLELDGPHFDCLDRKFEPESLRIEQIVLVNAHGTDIE